MADQLSAFASEVTRVALKVGIQGILGRQAQVEDVQGAWADLTWNIEMRSSSLSFSPVATHWLTFFSPLPENDLKPHRLSAFDRDEGCGAW